MNNAKPNGSNILLNPELCGDNMTIAAIKKAGQNSFFLGAVIFYGLNTFFSFLIQSGISPGAGQTTDTRFQPESIIFIVFSALIFAGLLTFYFSCRTQKYSGVKPTGLKIVFYTHMVEAVLIALVGLALIFVLKIDTVQSIINALEQNSYEIPAEVKERLSDPGFLTILKVVIFIMVLIIELVFTAILLGIRKVTKSIKYGISMGKIPIIIAIMLIFVVVTELFSIFKTELSAITLINSITGIIANGLFTVSLFMYNSEMSQVWYF